MTFKDFLKEMEDGAEGPSITVGANETPAEIARKRRLAQNNPKRAAMQQANKEKLQAKAAKQDDAMTPEQKRAEEFEAKAAQQRARAAQRAQ